MTTDDMPTLNDGRLAEYALGTLEPAEAAGVEALLARSAEARAELRSLREAIVGLTESLPPVQPPAHVWERLQARLERTETATPPVVVLPHKRPGPGYLGWALAACLSLLALGEGLWLSSSRTAYREAEREAYLVTEFLAAPEVEKITLYGRERKGIGNVLTRADGEALFVLAQAPAANRVYQAWGHSSDDWEPGSDARLTSLGVSDDRVFEVATQKFAALYLSLEPAGGSPQPTFPLSRISLTEPVTTAPLRITVPANGAVIEGERVIVSGVVASNVTNLSYVLNGEPRQTTVVGSRFSFTAPLKPGANTLVVRAGSPQAVTTERLTLIRR